MQKALLYLINLPLLPNFQRVSFHAIFLVGQIHGLDGTSEPHFLTAGLQLESCLTLHVFLIPGNNKLKALHPPFLPIIIID